MLSADEILERAQWDFFWARGERAAVVDRPELLYIRSARDLIYLNTVVRTRASRDRCAELAREIAAAHAGVRSRWLVCPQSRPRELASVLGDFGYAAGPDSHGYVLPVDDYQARATAELEVRRIDRMPRLRDWYRVTALAFGHTWAVEEFDLQQQLAACSDPAGRIHRFVAYEISSGAPIAAGDMRLYPELGFGYLLAGCTVPEARGRGAYSALLRTRVETARAHGVGLVGLYAGDQTSGKVVARQGFTACGPMSYWERPA